MCYNSLIIKYGDLISCPFCGLSIQFSKENGINDIKILPQIRQVKTPRLQKKLVRFDNLAKT